MVLSGLDCVLVQAEDVFHEKVIIGGNAQRCVNRRYLGTVLISAQSADAYSGDICQLLLGSVIITAQLF